MIGIGAAGRHPAGDILFKDRLLFMSNTVKESQKPSGDPLAGIELLSGLDRKELKKLRDFLHLRKYSAGDTVFAEGDPGLGIYMIIKGSVNIAKNEQGRVNIVDKIGPGEACGFQALLEKDYRDISAEAAEDSEIVVIFRPDVEHVFKTDPAIGVKLLLNLAGIMEKKIKKLNAELALALKKSAAEDSKAF